jgi:hypothetical protein
MARSASGLPPPPRREFVAVPGGIDVCVSAGGHSWGEQDGNGVLAVDPIADRPFRHGFRSGRSPRQVKTGVKGH